MSTNIRVTFYDGHTRLLHDAKMPAVPREGDNVRIENGDYTVKSVHWNVTPRQTYITIYV